MCLLSGLEMVGKLSSHQLKKSHADRQILLYGGWRLCPSLLDETTLHHPCSSQTHHCDDATPLQPTPSHHLLIRRYDTYMGLGRRPSYQDHHPPRTCLADGLRSTRQVVHPLYYRCSFSKVEQHRSSTSHLPNRSRWTTSQNG